MQVAKPTPQTPPLLSSPKPRQAFLPHDEQGKPLGIFSARKAALLEFKSHVAFAKSTKDLLLTAHRILYSVYLPRTICLASLLLPKQRCCQGSCWLFFSLHSGPEGRLRKSTLSPSRSLSVFLSLSLSLSLFHPVSNSNANFSLSHSLTLSLSHSLTPALSHSLSL